MPLDADGFKGRQRQLWSVGDYGAMAPQYQLAADRLISRLDLEPGMRLLDVATGTGNAAITAALAGAEVTGVDLTPELFDEAHWRAEELGLAITWDEGDAEALPYPDASFDRAVSVFGLMFTPDPRAAAGELVRVLGPGGRFGLCNWSLRGMVLAVVEALFGQGAVPVSDGSPLPWGEPDLVSEFFAGLGVTLEFERDVVSWLFSDAEDGVRWLEEVSGPVIAARTALQRDGRWAEARARLLSAVESRTRPDLDGVWIEADYLMVLGRVGPAFE